MIVSKVSGQSYEDYILELVHSLEMEHTYPDLSEENLQQHATGYGLKFPNEPRPVLKHTSANSMNSATGLSSNVEDLIKFYQHYLLFLWVKNMSGYAYPHHRIILGKSGRKMLFSLLSYISRYL